MHAVATTHRADPSPALLRHSIAPPHHPIISFHALPPEVLLHIASFMHPHSARAARRLCRAIYRTFSAAPSFAFARRNLLNLTSPAHPLALQPRPFAWVKLPQVYTEAVIQLLGITYHSLSVLGIRYEEGSPIETDSRDQQTLRDAISPVDIATRLRNSLEANIAAGRMTAWHWQVCDALTVQVASISGWSTVFDLLAKSNLITDTSDQPPADLDLALLLAALNGCTSVAVSILTNDQLLKSVNLAFDDSAALRYAFASGNWEIVKLIAQASTSGKAKVALPASVLSAIHLSPERVFSSQVISFACRVCDGSCICVEAQ
ncbi:hypothetical protein HDU84_003570 [Entophlyctis sp. JEL0112]|nr:hypothetical protein HDU84_003570 [Entophlyctis sp. JEL0112]